MAPMPPASTIPFSDATPILGAERVRLRPIAPADLAVVHQGLSDRRVTEYYAVHFDTLEETREQMRWFAQNERNGSGRWWAICAPADAGDNARMVGACGFNTIDRFVGRVELGYWLLPEAWGQGLVSDALRAALAHVWSLDTVHFVLAQVEIRNPRSIAVLERLGFVEAPPDMPRLYADEDDRLFIATNARTVRD